MTGDGSHSQRFRKASGGLIDRSERLQFSVDGKSYVGHPGDTLASALVANGVRLVGRSFKYHRPRGILSAGAEEPNALVELRQGAKREPNTRATQIELYDGLVATSQNRWPSLAFDVMAINGLAGPLLSAGFYYKTFMWPAAFWEKLYEPLIRRAAGLGRASGVADPDVYEKANHHCDVLVVGSGPAGLMAALTAGRSGARVLLAEQDFRLGGRLLAEATEVGGAPAQDWLTGIIAELASLPDVRILARTSVFASYDQKAFAAVEQVSDHLAQPHPYQPRQRMWRIFAKRTIIATGSFERHLVFGNNDRPGIMLAGAVRTYLNRYGAVPGTIAVVFAANDDAAATARDLAQAGVTIAAIIDPRPDSSAAMQSAARAVDAQLLAGSVIRRALGGAGGVRAVEVTGPHISGPNGLQTIDCDLVAMSGGWNPTLHLTSHLGDKPVWNPQISAFVPDTLSLGMQVAGAATGRFSLADALASGAAAAIDAATATGFNARRPDIPDVAPENTSGTPLWRVKTAVGKSFVDFQNDVTTDDVELAEREGFRSLEHLKRYTTLGMATDQGKTANVTGLALMAEITGTDIGSASPTTFRPPFTAVAIGALAGSVRGRHYLPTRYTPSHAWAEKSGAVFVEAGAWLRAQYFPQRNYFPHGNEGWLSAATREAKAVRDRVGFCDVSTLGKIELQGRDAAIFLDRLYANMMSTLAISRVRYGLMLREDGFVLDDGTVARLGHNRYLITTTTANAVKVMQHMEFCAQVLWPGIDVRFSSVTDHWAQFSIAGPHSRDVGRKLVDRAFDVSNDAVPYMAVAAVTICGGINAYLYRISFSGELAYELAVPARYGNSLAAAITTAGAEFGIRPYGTEALSMLRIEKGHVAGGELNGQTTARDLGLGRMLSAKKDFIGKVLSQRPALTAPERPVLVGVRPVDRSQPLSAGAHFVAVGRQPTIENDLGHLTSATVSPVFGHAIGIGLLAEGTSRIGQRVIAHDPVRGRSTEVEVCHPVFYDPDGGRLRG